MNRGFPSMTALLGLLAIAARIGNVLQENLFGMPTPSLLSWIRKMSKFASAAVGEV